MYWNTNENKLVYSAISNDHEMYVNVVNAVPAQFTLHYLLLPF